MITDKNFCIELLKDIMKHAFQTETLYFEPPYKEVLNVPFEIAHIMWPNYSATDSRLIPSVKTPERRFFVIKTNLEFYYILIFLNLEIRPDLVSIGPFRSDDLPLKDFEKDFENADFTTTTLLHLKNYYENLPCVSLKNIINTVSYIINSYLPDGKNLPPIYVDFEKWNAAQLDYEFEQSSILTIIPEDLAEPTKETFCHLVNALINGDIETTQEEMKNFLTETKILSIKKEIPDGKRILHMINDFFQMTLLNTHIQSVEAVKLYVKLIKKIEAIQERDTLIKMPYEICYKYCVLCQNNTFPEYSKTVSNVINYIHAHIQEPLTLSLIAEHFQKNSSALSYSFKENTGMTIINYINQAKINKAIEYFNTTALSVSEVALTIGFQNFAYFSRTFKKYTGYSPKEYRDLHT